MADIFDDDCECCGIPYRDHNEDTVCFAHRIARRIVGRAMDKVFFPEGAPGDE